jgi:hypothetical protein
MTETRRKSSKARRTDWLFLAFHPLYWRVRTRRLFLVTAPAAIPLWALGVCALLVVAILREPAAMFAKLWIAKPRRRHSYTDYRYGESQGMTREETTEEVWPPSLPAAEARHRLRALPPANDAGGLYRWAGLAPEPAEHRVDRIAARAKRGEQQPEQDQAGRREGAANAEFGIDHRNRHREVNRAN